jgi:hypothetical protein
MTPRFAIWALAVATVSCGPPSVRPANYADPDVSCPGGLSSWNLEILDQRVDREGSDKMVAAVRDGLQKSFPGCKWTSGPSAGAPTISIEIHRFASNLERDREGTSSWEAAADWTVRATNAGGRTLTEFQATEETSRPNYRGSNNEKESLSEVYQKALERTVKGLRSVPAIGAVRLPPGTVNAAAASGDKSEDSEKPLSSRDLSRPTPGTAPLERKSQPQEAS